MDPEVLIEDVEAFVKNGDLTEALVLLTEYAVWRSKGGFDPGGCDEKARALRLQVRERMIGGR